MRKLVVTEFLSLDGVMQAPGSPEEDTEGGFRQGGWAGPFIDEVFGAEAVAGMTETDAQLFGRKTYEIMAAYWPTAPSDDPYAKHLNSVRKYVASRTLDRVDWHNSTLLEGDVATAVAELKEQPGGNISVLGSGDLVQTLIEHDLVDEYSLALFPIALGSGKRLFREADRTRTLTLLDAKPTTTGGLILRYAPAH
ncbi:MAG: dihydrofolate reductase family protein [Solirubrobacterales bacterium]